MALAFACVGAAAPLPAVSIFKDIAPGPGSSNAAGLFTVNGKLLFSAGGADYGLWSSDGTPAGTVPILPGGAGLLGTAGSTAYLTRLNYSTCTTELWKTDGRAAGTTEVTDLGMGFAGPGAALAGKLYFGFFHAAATNSDCNSFTTTTGTQLWRTDGTGPGTVLVKDWDPLYGGQINELFSDGSTLYIGGGFVDDAELWKSDGTDTTLVKDINPIVVSGLYPQGSYPHNFVSLAGTVYFVAYDGSGYQLWKTDGTEAGTSLAVGLSSGIGGFWSAGGRLYFDGSDGSQFGAWASDGTQANTHFLGDVALGYGPPVALGGTVYFLGDQAGVAGLWKTDGTAAGTTLIKAIATPQPHGARAPGELTVAGSRLFFAADDGPHGKELWSSDGTTNGTALLADIDPAPGGRGFGEGSQPEGLTAFGGNLYFSADDGGTTYGRELWVARPTGLELRSVSRLKGCTGTEVDLRGTGLSAVTDVMIGGTPLRILSRDDSLIRGEVAMGTVSGPLVLNSPGASIQGGRFVVPAPRIASLAPASGRPGTLVTLTGSCLSGATRVAFNGMPANWFSAVTDTTLWTRVPPGATTGKVAVTTPSGTGFGGKFTVLP